MRIPPQIRVGDKIAIISTARKVSERELNFAIELIKSWGLIVILGKYLFKHDNQFAGNKNERASDLQEMINDVSIKAIICARGGYGTVQIIDKIDFSHMKKSPKWIIGYSDITVLHSHLNIFGIASIHASMPINFHTNTPLSLESLKNILFQSDNIIKVSSHRLNRLGQAKAEIVGGNLSILYSLLGSPSDLDTFGKILFIEEVDEYLYHIDRMMVNLKRNEKFKNLKGLIVGGMTKMNDNDIPYGKICEEIILEHVSDYDFPVCFGFPSGHLEENRAFKLGCSSILDVQETGVIFSQS